MKNKKNVQKIKANPALFRGIHEGRASFKPLEHKNGKRFDNVDYFELLGRKCIEMDKANRNPSLPTRYGDYDPITCKVAKEVCKGIDAGMSRADLNEYIDTCINYEE